MCVCISFLLQRAKGLLIMGQSFIKHGGAAKDGLVDVGERMGISKPTDMPEYPSSPSEPSQSDSARDPF